MGATYATGLCGRMSSYESQRSSRGVERPELAVVESVLQVPVVKPFLQHHEDHREQLARRRADRLARALLPLLLLIELHQRRPRLVHHREHRPDGYRPQPLPAPLRNRPVPRRLARLPDRGRQPGIGDQLLRRVEQRDVAHLSQEADRREEVQPVHLEQPLEARQALAQPDDLRFESRDLGLDRSHLPQRRLDDHPVGGRHVLARGDPPAARLRGEGRARQRHPVTGERRVRHVLELGRHPDQRLAGSQQVAQPADALRRHGHLRQPPQLEEAGQGRGVRPVRLLLRLRGDREAVGVGEHHAADVAPELVEEVIDVLRHLDGDFVRSAELPLEAGDAFRGERVSLQAAGVVSGEEAGDEVGLVQVYSDVAHG